MDTVIGTATPINATNGSNCSCGCDCDYEAMEKMAEKTANAFGFSDEVEEDFLDEEEDKKTKESAEFLKNLQRYFRNGAFKRDVEHTSRKYKIPPKQIAKGFLMKVLGIIHDVTGIAINTCCNIVDYIVSAISTVLHGAVKIINDLANGLVSVVTLNQTVIAG
jgi:hypothetical protein